MAAGIAAFVPDRLREAREARGLSATQLSELVGMTKQSISAYENGRQIPSFIALNGIAGKLNLPLHFFVKAKRERSSSPTFFRSLTAATKRERTRAERRLDWLEDIIVYLSSFVEFLPVRLPNFDLGESPGVLSAREIENIARTCRKEMDLGDGPISNMVRLLENHGVITTRQDLDTTSLDAFSRRNEVIGVPMIVLGADKESAARSRFDAAHELGHLVLHRSITKLWNYHKITEPQAFRFASAFLMPAETFSRDLGSISLDTLAVLKRKWKLSIGAMLKRCQDLGMLREEQSTRLWISYTRSGYKKREPFDDVLEPEKPVYLARCLELLLSKGIQTREDVLATLSLASSDIEDLVGLRRGYLTSERGSVERLPTPTLRKQSRPQEGGPMGTVLPFPTKK